MKYKFSLLFLSLFTILSIPHTVTAEICCKAYNGSTPLPSCIATPPYCYEIGDPPGGTNYTVVVCERTPNCPGYTPTIPSFMGGPAQCCQLTESGGQQISCTAPIGTSCTPIANAPSGSVYQLVPCASTPGCPLYTAEPVKEPPSFTPVLPRLQVNIPTLQPFTVFKQTDAQGRTFLNVNFIGPYIVGLYKYLVGIGGIAAGIMFVWAGVKWLTSAGNAEGIGDAKKKIGGASVGLVLLLGSYVVLKLVNPELVIFKPLQVEFVDPELLEEFEEKDLETETFAPAMSIGDTTYDEIFQSFANCTPADWRFLKAIAYKESGLNTNKVNPSNYIGLFQTKQANCEDALKGYPQHQSACADLTNPSVNTAVGALMMRSALQKIRGKCASASTLEKLTMVYINHNMGPAVLRYAMDVGCTLPQLKQGSINYYTSNERGKRTAQNYASKYQPACLQEKTPAECTAVPKFDYSVSTARATQGLGVSKIEAPATGPCPLSSAEPF